MSKKDFVFWGTPLSLWVLGDRRQFVTTLAGHERLLIQYVCMKKGAKSVTIDDLAIMVAKGFDDVKKELKTEFKKELNTVKTDLSDFKNETSENFKKVRSDILNMGDRFVPRHEFDSFLMRFHRLEQKVDSKIAK